ncbi:MAG: DNRLRE domain-containing protein [Opitutaceae bacterium]|jgi:hypothetical protein|nr:DNRLRE domain-containing protein [Opitutaceae bacterium]
MTTSKHIKSALLASLIIAASSTTASAASATATLSADTYVRHNQPAYAFGNTDLLWIGHLNANSPFRTLLTFDLPVLPENAVITSVSLTLYQVKEDTSSSPGSSMTVDLYRTNTPFTEATTADGGATWTNTGNGGSLDSAVLSSATARVREASGTLTGLPRTITWESSDLFVSVVRSAWSAGDSSISFLLKETDESAASRLFLQFASKEYATQTGLAPALLVGYTVVPEPSTTAILLGLGALSAAGAGAGAKRLSSKRRSPAPPCAHSGT